MMEGRRWRGEGEENKKQCNYNETTSAANNKRVREEVELLR